jgi:hypothetical protein
MQWRTMTNALLVDLQRQRFGEIKSVLSTHGQRPAPQVGRAISNELTSGDETARCDFTA